MGKSLLSNSEIMGSILGILWSMKLPSYFPSLKEFNVTGQARQNRVKTRVYKYRKTRSMHGVHVIYMGKVVQQ
jgi:hypothetical protein